MFWLKRIGRFAFEMCKTWGAALTGGFVIGLLGSWQLTGHSIPPKVGWGIIMGAIVLASFQVWNREADITDLAQRRRQHIFILKAMTKVPDGYVPAPVQHSRFDLYTIDNRVRLAQYAEAVGEDIGLLPTIEEEQEIARELCGVEKCYGLPSVRDPERRQKIEDILHEMVNDNKLRFEPPSMWSIV
jgi:hypothetical protein